jgi:small multidrug resistance pump
MLTVRTSLAFWIVVSLSAACTIADYWLKRASNMASPFRSAAFISGLTLYALSAFGWVYVFRHYKLATISAFFSLFVVVSLAIMGVVAFRESLSTAELVGLGCAVAALVLLGRFH